MSIQVSTPWAEILGFAILFGVVLLFAAIELWRPPRPPVRASRVNDAPRMWEDDIEVTREREAGDFDLWEADLQQGSGL